VQRAAPPVAAPSARAAMSKRFLDKDLSGYNPKKPGDDRRNHLSKHKQRDRALEVAFDPAAHREYVTGFRRRKAARRKEALRGLEQQERVQKLEERAVRRAALRAELGDDSGGDGGSDGGEAPSGSGSSDGEGGGGVRVFSGGGLTSTVTVQRIGGGESDEEGTAAAAARRRPLPQPKALKSWQRPRDAHAPKLKPWQQKKADKAAAAEEAGEEAGPKKMTKHSLRVLTKTRMKLDGSAKKSRASKQQGGKKGGGGGKGKKGGGGKKR
jgi:ribosomal RNA-processing protein 17